MNDRLDLYLDGLLEGAELAEFEALLAERADLREQVALSRRADETLRSTLAYEPAPPLTIPGAAEKAEVAGRIRPAARGTNWRRLALAAAVVLGGAGVWAGYVHMTTPSFERLIPPDTLYGQLVAGGFKPEFVCTDDAGFAKAVKDRLGTALHLTPAAGMVALGWAYGDSYQGKLIGDRTLVFMATVDGQNVVVLMDRLSADRPMVMPDACGLHIYRAEAAGLVLYEVSHFEKARVLPHLHP